jgi:hypothetical protein
MGGLVSTFHRTYAHLTLALEVTSHSPSEFDKSAHNLLIKNNLKDIGQKLTNAEFHGFCGQNREILNLSSELSTVFVDNQGVGTKSLI